MLKNATGGVEAENPSDTVEETSGADSSKRGRGKKSPGGTKPTKLPSCSLPTNMTPTFYVGGGNGVSLVEGALVNIGWKRTTDKFDERFRLKWVECKSRINYGAFKEGEQLVNHLPNSHLLTNKLGLLNSLKEYERVTLSTKGRLPRLRMSDFHPETYKLDEKSDQELFLEVYKDNEIWICKPVGMNQGKGIFLIRSRAEITQLLEERELKKQQQQKPGRPLANRIVQRYILNPLLLDGRKFDVRAYMLVASTVPFLILYHKGYLRLSVLKYDVDDSNLGTHLTNQFVQKKDPSYKELKEETAWTMDKFNDYVNEHVRPNCPVEIEEDWVYNTFTKQMQKIMIHCFNSVKHKLQSRVGFFDLFGLDFMVDEQMRTWLLEMNVNPSLSRKCRAQKELLPGLIQESLYVSIECFEKTKKNLPLMPLQSLKNFTILYCGTRPNTILPRQSRSVSPVKDSNSGSSAEKATATSSLVAGGVRRAASPTRVGQRNLTQSTPLFTSSMQRRISDREKNDLSKPGASATSSAKTVTTTIGGGVVRPKTETEVKKVIPIVCKEADSSNKANKANGKEQAVKNDSKEPKGNENSNNEKDPKESHNEKEKNVLEPVKSSENKVKTTVVVDTLTKTTVSLNQARLSLSLDQVGLADSLLEEVRLKMTHAEMMNSMNNTPSSNPVSAPNSAKPTSAKSGTRERENLERGN